MFEVCTGCAAGFRSYLRDILDILVDEDQEDEQKIIRVAPREQLLDRLEEGHCPARGGRGNILGQQPREPSPGPALTLVGGQPAREAGEAP